MNKTIILNVDSYKCSMWQQYPEKTSFVYSYIESRGSKIPNVNYTLFFGLQMFIKEYLAKPITLKDIDIAERIIEAHGEPFNRAGWEYIINQHGGYLPLIIKAVPEGTVVPTGNILLSVENTDPECAWLTSYIETAILRGVWYPTTVATISYAAKQLIKKYLEETSDDLSGLPFKLHDFGMRGVSSFESGGIGGLAHLVNFMGTDTITSLLYADEYYNPSYSNDIAGFSIPASEHSTITSWGKDGEVEAYRNMIRKFGTGAIFACVSDSYDIFNAVENLWGGTLQEEVKNQNAILVVRPDCYDEETQIMTDTGWKFFKDLDENDLVAQVDDNNKYSFIKPTKIIKQRYSGEMVRLSNYLGKVDLLVTPNHRLVFSYAGEERIFLASDLPNKFSDKYKKYRSAALKSENDRNITDFERLQIAFQADGSYTSTGNKIRFSFSKQRKMDRLERIIGKLELPYKRYSLADGRSEYHIDVDSSLFRKDFEWVPILGETYCKDFIEEVSYWDSCRRTDNRFKFDNTNEHVADIVELIALSAGYGVYRTSRKDNRKDIFSDVHTLHIMKDNLVGMQEVVKSVETYDGNVYCVKVPSGKIIIKRNKAVLVSGNSGDPNQVIPICLNLLDAKFGSTINSKGYKLLNKVRVIQGDGITIETIPEILEAVKAAGFSTDNLAMGMGGGLLQHCNRDTFKFAMKCSAAVVNGKVVDVYKDPITDKGKKSKTGYMSLLKDGNSYRTIKNIPFTKEDDDVLEIVYLNGRLMKDEDLSTIRKRSDNQ